MNTGEALNQIIDIIVKISEEFYRQQDSKGYTDLDGFFEYIGLLLGDLELQKNAVTVKELNSITVDLNRIMEALKEKDGVLIADILRYDIGNSVLNILDYMKENAVIEEEV